MQLENVIRMSDIETQAQAPTDGGAAAPSGGQGAGRQGRAKRKASAVAMGNLNRLMQHFVLIYGTKTVWDGEAHRIVPIDALRLAMTNDAIKFWLASPERRMVMPEQLMFEPGQDLPEGCIQLFKGLEVAPLPCSCEDVQPMLDLLEHLCKDSADSPEGVKRIMDWVLRWQAYALQNLGSKMQTAIVMHGSQGTGKNLYWDVWRDLFGSHGVTVSQNELEDKFNGWLSAKLAIIGDEVVSRQEMYHNKNRLKLIVTQKGKFPIREMQQSTRWETNHANVVFLSNETKPLQLEDRDRRYLVIYTPLAAAPELYERVRDFLAKDGARKWLHYLLTLDLADFDAHTKPIMTRSKQELIEAGWTPTARFASEWLGGFLPLPLRVCSSDQLYRAFQRWCTVSGERWSPSKAGFSADLNRWVKENASDDSSRALEQKVINITGSGARKSQRCWVPNGAKRTREFPTEGDWAAECIRTFEDDLYQYTRDLSGRSHGHEED
jgi:hypothetical protein